MIRQPLFTSTPPPRGAQRKRARGAFRHTLRLLVAMAAAALPACSIDHFDSKERVFGHIAFDDLHSDFHIPDTATVGVPVRLAVWTQGAGCHEGGDTEVDVDGLSAVVTPYDYLDKGAGVCTLILLRFDHGTTVVFTEPGDAEVELRYSTDDWDHNADGRKVFPVKVSPAR